MKSRLLTFSVLWVTVIGFQPQQQLTRQRQRSLVLHCAPDDISKTGTTSVERLLMEEKKAQKTLEEAFDTLNAQRFLTEELGYETVDDLMSDISELEEEDGGVEGFLSSLK